MILGGNLNTFLSIIMELVDRESVLTWIEQSPESQNQSNSRRNKKTWPILKLLKMLNSYLKFSHKSLGPYRFSNKFYVIFKK